MRAYLLNIFDFHQNSKGELWFSGIFAILTAVFWTVALWGFSVKVTDSTYLLALLFFGVVWIVTVVLADILLSKNLLILNFGFLTIVLLFLFGLNLYNALAVSLFIALIYLAHKLSKRFRENTIEFKTVYLSRKFLGIFFIGLAIFLAFAYNNFILKDYIENPRISPQVYHTVFAPAETVVGLLIPGYQKGMAVEEFQQVFLEFILPAFLPAQFDGLNTSNISVLDSEIASQTLEELTLEWLNENMRLFMSIGSFAGIVPFIFIFAMFLSFKFLLWPVAWLAAGLALLTMKVLSFYNIIIFKKVEIVKSVPKLE